MAPPPPPQRKAMLLSPDPGQQRFLTALIGRGGWRAMVAPDADVAQAMLGTQDGLTLDAVVIDDALVPAPPTNSPDLIGLPSIAPDDLVAAAVRALRAWRPALPIIILDSAADAATLGAPLGRAAMAAVAAGADDVLARPVTADRLLTALDRVVEPSDLRHELRPYSYKFAAPLAFEALVGSAPLFRNALAIAAKAARGRVPVLIEGAAGVGKDAFAQAIHGASPRARGPLLSIDCASVAPGLLASGLFGHERGAFPGAFDRHVGQLSRADGGTLVIDRIECLPLDTQARLIDWLRTGIVQPLGGQTRATVDVRIVATSATTLMGAIQAGTFREDLYYGLTTTQVAIPALNERRGDIPALARHFLDRLSLHPAMPTRGIDEGALRLLGRYRWPGNVRQLQDALIRAAVQCTDLTLTVADFPGVEHAVRREEGHAVQSPVHQVADAGGVTLYLADGNLRPLEDIESDVIRLAICHYRGRMTEVARRLGIGRSTLYRKLGDLGIDTAA